MGKFQKGQSGNPGGRPKEVDEVKELARQHGPEAVKKLVDWLRSDNAKASVSAANALLDRGYGKPAQPLEHSGEIETSNVARVPMTFDTVDAWQTQYPSKTTVQ